MPGRICISTIVVLSCASQQPQCAWDGKHIHGLSVAASCLKAQGAISLHIGSVLQILQQGGHIPLQVTIPAAQTIFSLRLCCCWSGQLTRAQRPSLLLDLLDSSLSLPSNTPQAYIFASLQHLQQAVTSHTNFSPSHMCSPCCAASLRVCCLCILTKALTRIVLVSLHGSQQTRGIMALRMCMIRHMLHR